jgi:hypothetical protein
LFGAVVRQDKNSAITTTSTGPVPSAKRKNNTEDALQIVQAEGKSKVRRERLFAAGKAEGLAEGTKLGRALGSVEGIERGNPGKVIT